MCTFILIKGSLSRNAQVTENCSRRARVSAAMAHLGPAIVLVIGLSVTVYFFSCFSDFEVCTSRMTCPLTIICLVADNCQSRYCWVIEYNLHRHVCIEFSCFGIGTVRLRRSEGNVESWLRCSSLVWKLMYHSLSSYLSLLCSIKVFITFFHLFILHIESITRVFIVTNEHNLVAVNK